MVLLKIDDLINVDCKQFLVLYMLKVIVENCYWGYFFVIQVFVIKVKSGDFIQVEVVMYYVGDVFDLMMDDVLKVVWVGIFEEDCNFGVYFMIGFIYVEGV